MDENTEYLGYIQYSGISVEQGYLDARKSAEALLGIDEALRYFVGRQSQELSKVDYEIPVRIRQGSWQALIPHDIPSWIMTVLGIGVTAYVTTAATKMAENDFRDASLRQLFQKAILAIQWFIRIGKHLGSITKRTFENVKWRNGNTEVGIPNEKGIYLYIPIEYYKFYEHVPVNILYKIASIVTLERRLDIVVRLDNHDETESVEYQHKDIFCPVDSVLFPELEHGKEVTLDGIVTRGNENANSIGFQYNGHILTCFPSDGSIVRFKPALFLFSRINGTVTRSDKFGNPIELRPKIIVSSVTPIEQEGIITNLQPLLFNIDEE